MAKAPLEIRKYRPEDREGVRRLCVQVAVFGEPLEQWLDLDEEIFADLFTEYYTDYEAESIFVAVSEGRVVAYLALCRDTLRSQRIVNYVIITRCLVRLASGKFRLGWKWLQVFWLSILEWVKYGAVHLPYDEYPAHFHLNIAQDFRMDRRIWLKLIPMAFRHAYNNGMKRIHGLGIAKRGEYEQTYANFGFKILKRQPCLIRKNVTDEDVHWLLIGTDLDEWMESLPPAFKRFFSEGEEMGEVVEGAGGKD